MVRSFSYSNAQKALNSLPSVFSVNRKLLTCLSCPVLIAALLVAAQVKKQAEYQLNQEVKFNSPVDDLTLIRLAQREQAFDQVTDNLDAQRVKAYWQRRSGSNGSDSGQPSQEFFFGQYREFTGCGIPRQPD